VGLAACPVIYDAMSSFANESLLDNKPSQLH
jgi:hypothetical protein